MKFNSVHIEARDLDDAWYQLLYNINKFGREYRIDSGSYKGHTRLEFDDASGFIKRPHDGPLAPKMPESSTLPVPTDVESIQNYFANYLLDPNLKPDEEYRYSTWINGQMLEYPQYCQDCKCSNLYWKDDAFGTNQYFCKMNHKNLINVTECPNKKPNTQLEWCIDHFQKRGYGNNHCYINIGDRYSCLAYDKPYKTEAKRGTSPCLRGIDLKIKEKTLILGVVFRSWDLYGGFPENMGGFTLLNEYISSQLDDVKPGPLTFKSQGLHCYDFQLEILKQRLNK